MELRHLRYFAAVATQLSFRKAAERLRVAQPALSKQIKDLETEIGVQLLRRDTRGVQLTAAGALFLDETQDILERVDLAVVAAQEAEAGRAGKIVIGNPGALGSRFLPQALTQFRLAFPRVEVEVSEHRLTEQMTSLREGSIQVGFGLGLEPVPPGFEAATMMKSKLCVALAETHPWAKLKQISLRDLSDETFFYIGFTAQDTLHRDAIHGVFARRGLRHRPLRRVNGYEALLASVAGHLGLSLILEFPSGRAADGVVTRRIKEDDADLLINLSVVWRPTRGVSLAENFVQVLKDLEA